MNKFLYFFRARDFSSDSYSWLLNQFGHLSLSYFLSVLICPYLMVIVWLAWEYRHYKQTRDKEDLVYDLFFEIGGVLMFFFFKPALIVCSLALITITTIKYVKEINTSNG